MIQKTDKIEKTGYIPASPIAIAWNFTYSCNMNCDHCYTRTEKGKELSHKEKMLALEKMLESKVLQINIGGGEPLLSPSFFHIARHAKKNGMDVALSSNGSLIDEKMAKKIADSGVDCVNISLDSTDPQKHDKFRNFPGAFKKAISAIKFLKKYKVKVKIVSVLSRLNFKETEKIVNLGIRLKVNEVIFKNYKPSGKGLINLDQYDLTPKEWKKLYTKLFRLKRSSPVRINLGAEPILVLLEKTKRKKEDQILFSGNPCGTLSLCIKPNGDITACVYVKVIIGNIIKDDLLKIWHQSPFLLKVRNKKPEGKCKICPHFEKCLGGCFAVSYNLRGKINSPDPHCWWAPKTQC